MPDDELSNLEQRLRPHFGSIGDTMARSQSRIVASLSLIRNSSTSVEITCLRVERSKRRLAKTEFE